MLIYNVKTEQEKTYLRELLWINVVKLFGKKNTMNPKTIINLQKKLVNSYNILGKNKYKTVNVLVNYFNNPNKALSEQIFWNTIKNKVNLELI